MLFEFYWVFVFTMNVNSMLICVLKCLCVCVSPLGMLIFNMCFCDDSNFMWDMCIFATFCVRWSKFDGWHFMFLYLQNSLCTVIKICCVFMIVAMFLVLVPFVFATFCVGWSIWWVTFVYFCICNILCVGWSQFVVYSWLYQCLWFTM